MWSCLDPHRAGKKICLASIPRLRAWMVTLTSSEGFYPHVQKIPLFSLTSVSREWPGRNPSRLLSAGREPTGSRTFCLTAPRKTTGLEVEGQVRGKLLPPKPPLFILVCHALFPVIAKEEEANNMADSCFFLLVDPTQMHTDLTPL